jgi:hypothetical protein
MVDPALARRLEMTGWSTVLLGIVCAVLAAIQALTPILLEHLAAALDAADDPTRAIRESWSAGAGTGAWVNGLFGAALIVIGIAVSRRARWAHGALTVSCWASIAVLAVLAKPTLAPFFAMAGGSETSGGMLAAGAALLVAQVAAVLWFLRFWRKPEVREAFR